MYQNPMEQMDGHRIGGKSRQLLPHGRAVSHGVPPAVPVAQQIGDVPVTPHGAAEMKVVQHIHRVGLIGFRVIGDHRVIVPVEQLFQDLQAVLIILFQQVSSVLLLNPLDDLVEDMAIHFIQEPAGNFRTHSGEGLLQDCQELFQVLPVVHVGERRRQHGGEHPAAVLQQVKGVPGVKGILQRGQKTEAGDPAEGETGEGGVDSHSGGDDLVLHDVQKHTVSGGLDLDMAVQVVPDHAGHRVDAVGAGALGETLQQGQDVRQLLKVTGPGGGVGADAPQLRQLVEETQRLAEQGIRVAVLDVLGDVDDFLAEFPQHPVIGVVPVREGAVGAENPLGLPQGQVGVEFPLRMKKVVQGLGQFRVLFDGNHCIVLLLNDRKTKAPCRRSNALHGAPNPMQKEPNSRRKNGFPLAN